jgi:CarD family transcriptional regulator
MSKALSFEVGERVVYPSHGVGEITNIETQSIGGIGIQVYVISFPQDKMILRAFGHSQSIFALAILLKEGF